VALSWYSRGHHTHHVHNASAIPAIASIVVLILVWRVPQSRSAVISTLFAQIGEAELHDSVIEGTQ